MISEVVDKIRVPADPGFISIVITPGEFGSKWQIPLGRKYDDVAEVSELRFEDCLDFLDITGKMGRGPSHEDLAVVQIRQLISTVIELRREAQVDFIWFEDSPKVH